MYVCTHAVWYTYVKVRRQVFRNWFSPATWVLRIQLRSLSLTASLLMLSHLQTYSNFKLAYKVFSSSMAFFKHIFPSTFLTMFPRFLKAGIFIFYCFITI